MYSVNLTLNRYFNSKDDVRFFTLRLITDFDETMCVANLFNVLNKSSMVSWKIAIMFMYYFGAYLLRILKPIYIPNFMWCRCHPKSIRINSCHLFKISCSHFYFPKWNIIFKMITISEEPLRKTGQYIYI